MKSPLGLGTGVGSGHLTATVGALTALRSERRFTVTEERHRGREPVARRIAFPASPAFRPAAGSTIGAPLVDGCSADLTLSKRRR
jgi:hypothetical protein